MAIQAAIATDGASITARLISVIVIGCLPLFKIALNAFVLLRTPKLFAALSVCKIMSAVLTVAHVPDSAFQNFDTFSPDVFRVAHFGHLSFTIFTNSFQVTVWQRAARAAHPRSSMHLMHPS
jgi:hypothetical protein